MFNCKVHTALKQALGSSFLTGRLGKNNTELLECFREYWLHFQTSPPEHLKRFAPSDQAPPNI